MKNKTILITGASRGIGLLLANHWIESNNVIIISRTHNEKLNSKIHFYKCDLGNEEELVAVTKIITKAFPKIDLLVNNAAILTTAPLSVLKNENISKMIDVNLKAPIFLSKLIFRKMIQEKSGQIINVLSMATKLSLAGDSVYAASKSGLEAFSKVLNKEGHPFGVHVNNISLSAFPSEMLSQVTGSDNTKILSLIPHKQFAPLNEIIATIEFFEKNNTDLGGQTIYFGGVS